jgi:hypothetical protein
VYGPVLLVLPTALLTQLLYPFAYALCAEGRWPRSVPSQPGTSSWSG